MLLSTVPCDLRTHGTVDKADDIFHTIAKIYTTMINNSFNSTNGSTTTIIIRMA